MKDRTLIAIAAASLAMAAGIPFAPQSLAFLITLALAKGLVVLGLMLLMRTGLVSFGQGLYYCLGAYAAALVEQSFHVNDAAVMLAAAVVAAAAVAAVLGFLLAAYRGIFFAMLSMALSMILFGLLVKSSALGSTDGFNIATHSLFGAKIAGSAGRVLLGVTIVAFAAAAAVLHRYLISHLGRLSAAIRDNELRVEYLGASVRNVVHLNYVIAAALGGLGGGLTALAVGHIDPDMAYWTTSGEFVFVAVLSGTGNVLAPFAGSALFEAIRTLANQYAPNVWQMTLGAAMLVIIMFAPDGLWSLFRRRARAS